MRKVIKVILVLTLSCSFSALSTAGEAEHKELVKQLFTVTNMAEGFDSTCEEVINMQIQSNPMMLPFKGVITDFFTKYMSWKSMEPEITQLYMQTFTEDELREIVGFLASPVGIMYTEKSFDLTLKCMEIGQEKVNQNMNELEAMLAAHADKMIQDELSSPDNGDEETATETEITTETTEPTE